jgi:hypothetical protein
MFAGRTTAVRFRTVTGELNSTVPNASFSLLPANGFNKVNIHLYSKRRLSIGLVVAAFTA